MKIGDQGIDNFELKTRIDKEIRLSRAGLKFGTMGLSHDTFQHPAACGPDRNHAASSCLDLPDPASSFLTETKGFTVHRMICDHLLLNGPKGAKAYVQGQTDD